MKYCAPLGLAVFACGALALAGCGSKTLEQGDVEQSVSELIADYVKADLASVDCPDDIKAKKDDVFTCTVRGEDGTSAPVRIRQVDDDGHYSIPPQLFRTGALETTLEQRISDRNRLDLDAVACPDIALSKPGTKVACQGIAGKRTYDIDVTLTGETIRYRVKRR